MRKKISLVLVLCLVVSFMTGCDGNKDSFGMEIEELREQINENIQTLGFEITIPEFKKQYGQVAVNNVMQESDEDHISYVSQIGDYFYLTISPPTGMIGSTALLVVSFWTNDIEKANFLPDFIAVASGFIATIDPDADIQEILDSLEMESVSENVVLNFKSKAYFYQSDTTSDSMIFGVYKDPIMVSDQ